MNEQLQKFARQNLKYGLAQCPDAWNRTFKLMYARNGGKRSVEDAIAMPIDAVVDEIPEDRLDWAMTQIENSLKKLAAEKAPQQLCGQ